MTGTFGVVRKRYERVRRRSDLRSVDQLKVEGLRWRDQCSNAFRPGIRRDPRPDLVAGAGFALWWALSVRSCSSRVMLFHVARNWPLRGTRCVVGQSSVVWPGSTSLHS